MSFENTITAKSDSSLWQSLEERSALAADRELITPEIHKPNDYYGHATHLKRRLGLDHNYPLKVALMHGAPLINYVWSREWQSPMSIKLCHTQRYAETYMLVSGKPSIPVGPPLGYLKGVFEPAPPPEENRILLYVPPHSTHHLDVEYRFEEEARMIESVASGFDQVVVIVYWKDVLSGVPAEYEKFGFECVTAGHMFDPEFLPRFVNIVRSANAAVVSYGGSAALNLVLLGRPVWIPPLRMSLNANKKDYIDNWNDIKNCDWSLREEMYELFSAPEFVLTDKQVDFVHKHTGMNNLRSDDELRDIILRAEELYERSGEYAKRPTPPSIAQISEVQQAMRAVADSDYERAFEQVTSILATGRQPRGAELLLAVILASKGMLEESTNAAERELKRYPDNPEARALLRQLRQNGGVAKRPDK